MGIVTGYIGLISFFLLAGKFIARKSDSHKINRFFAMLHKPVSCIFLLTCIIHLILVIPVLKTRNLAVSLSGFLAFTFVLLLIVFCHTVKNGAKKMKWHRIFTLALLAGIIFHVTVYYIDFIQYKNNIQNIRITDVAITEVPDGSYIGAYDAGYIYAKVQVTVKDGFITEITILEHDNERGQKAEVITGTIVKEQKINVDAVSGATNSSLVIKKAVENALCQ